MLQTVDDHAERTALHDPLSVEAAEAVVLELARDADLFMCGSDYPHSEGTATPVADYTNSVAVADAPGLFGDNADFLLRR